MEQKSGKTCIIVLGMHRSGTSLLTGALNKMGLYLGEKLINPAPDNPKGFFENTTVFEINEKIFSYYDSSYDDVFIFNEALIKNEKYPQILFDIEQFIKKEFSGYTVFGLKDPRLCRLLPFWESVLTKMEINEYFIIPLRNPLEIAASLESRNGFTREKSLILWMNHMLEAELYSRGKNRIFINYDKLLNHPEQVLEYITGKLNIDYLKSYQEIKSELDDFFDSDLKHFNISNFKSDELFIKFVKEFYISLQNLSNNDINEEELTNINRQRERYYKLHRFFYNKDLIDLLKEAKSTNHILTNEIRRLVREKDNLLQEKENIIQKKENILQEIYNSRSWKLIATYRNLKNKIFPKHD